MVFVYLKSIKKKLSSRKIVHFNLTKQEERLQRTKARSNEEYQKMTQKYKDQVKKTQSRQESNLNQIRANNEDVIKGERYRGQEAEKELREDIAKRYERVDKLGEQKISDKKTSIETKEKKLDTEYQKNLADQKANYENREKRLQTEYNQRYMDKKQANEDSMRSQQRGFDSIYQKNETNNKVSLQIQARNYAKALAQQHRDFMTQSSKYSGKEDDPFYKVQDRGSELSEDRHFYVLKAYVPEHEKENVQVIIQKDRASVATQRQFNEKLSDDSGKKIETNSAQTLREEFSFDTPIITEGIARERSGDYVFVTIPKLQSFKNWNIKG